MRFATVCLCLIPSIGLAESYTLDSQIRDVTVYPTGNKITRIADFSIPAGRHVLILADLPTSIDPEAIRIQVEGAKLGTTTFRESYVPPRDDTKSPEVFAAEGVIETIEQKIRNVEDRAAQARLFAQAAEAQITFLGQIGASDQIGAAEIDTLRGISQMISQEALAARQSIHAARIEARLIERELEELQGELKDAKQALVALVPEDQERAYLSVSVEAGEATEGQMTLTYYSGDAVWAPVYDMFLTRGSAASLTIERGAIVQQNTGETWHDVNLTLSTVLPFSQIEPGVLYTQRRSIQNPQPPRARFSEDEAASYSEPVIAPAVIVEEASSMFAQFDGYAIVYTYPTPVTIATGADQVRLKLDTLTLGADISAKAIPWQDETAFLVANVTNDSGEVILPSGFVSVFVDDVFAGATDYFEGISVGDMAEIPFGPIEGLRLERVVLNQNQGDRGIISRSNQQTKTVQIEITNLTNDTWPVRLLDLVPYSEQEDLEITWQAEPDATDVNVDNRRGILGWDLMLNPGEKQMIRLDQTLSWPEGMLLR